MCFTPRVIPHGTSFRDLRRTRGRGNHRAGRKIGQRREARRPPHLELLLLLLRPELVKDDLERATALAATVEWSPVIAYAERHRVVPALQRGAASLPDVVPSAIANELRARRTAHVIRTLSLCADLVSALDALSAAGIDAIAYKGPSLSVQAHGDVTAREFEDLDLLVRPRDALRAGGALLEAGFDGPPPLAGVDERRLLRAGHERQYRGPGGSLVEVHWTPAPRYHSIALPSDALLTAAVAVTIAGRRVPTLCPEDTVVTLAVDAGKELFPTLRVAVDTAAFLVRHPHLDWRAVIEAAERAGAGRMLRVLLALARGLQAAPLPVSVHAAIDADAVSVELAAGFADRMLGPPGGLGRLPALDHRHLALRERRYDRARYLGRLAVTPTAEDIVFISLPPWTGALYLPIRTARLGAKYWRGSVT